MGLKSGEGTYWRGNPSVDGLNCHVCHKPSATRVKDTYHENGTTRRRRECPKCFTTFWTEERRVIAEEKQ